MIVTTEIDTPAADAASKRRTTLAEKAQLKAIARGIVVKRRLDGRYYGTFGTLLWPSWTILEDWVLARYREEYGALPNQSGIDAFVRFRQRLADACSA